jgi:hypothetical protein
VLPSVVMVLLATVATGLLVVIGFQAVGENVVATTFHRTDRESRNVDVSNSPSSPPRVTTHPAAPSATGAPQAPASDSRPRSGHPARPSSSRSGGNVTTAPKPTGGSGKTTAPKPSPAPATSKPAPKPAPKPSPSPTKSPSPTPSPTPTCGKGHRPKCPKISAPAVNTYSYTGYTQTSSGSTTATKPRKATKAAKTAKTAKVRKAGGHARRSHLAR